MKTIQIASAIEAVAHTVNAGWWTMLMARRFGRRVEVPGAGYRVTMAHWRGCWYVIKTTEVKA